MKVTSILAIKILFDANMLINNHFLAHELSYTQVHILQLYVLLNQGEGGTAPAIHLHYHSMRNM